MKHSELKRVSNTEGLPSWLCPKCILWCNIVTLSANIPENSLRERHLLSELENVARRLHFEEKLHREGKNRH